MTLAHYPNNEPRAYGLGLRAAKENSTMTNDQIAERIAVREFLHFWERSICADKHYKFWMARLGVGRV